MGLGNDRQNKIRRRVISIYVSLDHSPVISMIVHGIADGLYHEFQLYSKVRILHTLVSAV